jgi:hypothetical protein
MGRPKLIDSFPPRLFDYQYTDPSLEGTINTFVKSARSNFSATSGFDSLQVYVSYATKGQHRYMRTGSYRDCVP